MLIDSYRIIYIISESNMNVKSFLKVLSIIYHIYSGHLEEMRTRNIYKNHTPCIPYTRKCYA